MYKLHIKFLLISLTVLLFFVKCQKDNNLSNKETETNLKKEIIPNVAADPGGGGGSSCQVPVGYTSCNTSCLFSDCCVVWNPGLETGACGCYFGIAVCKTAKIGTSSSSSEISHSSRTINIHQDKFQQFFTFLKNNGIPINGIESSYNKLILAIIEGNIQKARVKTTSFDSFVEDYKNYINSLTENQKNLILEYVK